MIVCPMPVWLRQQHAVKICNCFPHSNVGFIYGGLFDLLYVDLLEMRSALGRWSRLASIGAGMREWKQCSPSNDVLALTCVWAMLGVLYSLDTIAVGTSD